MCWPELRGTFGDSSQSHKGEQIPQDWRLPVNHKQSCLIPNQTIDPSRSVVYKLETVAVEKSIPGVNGTFSSTESTSEYPDYSPRGLL